MSDRTPKLKPSFKAWLDDASAAAEHGHTVSFNGDYAASFAFLTKGNGMFNKATANATRTVNDYSSIVEEIMADDEGLDGYRDDDEDDRAEDV